MAGKVRPNNLDDVLCWSLAVNAIGEITRYDAVREINSAVDDKLVGEDGPSEELSQSIHADLGIT